MQIKSDMLTIKPIQRRLSTENRLDSPFSDGILGKNMPDAVEQNRKRNLIYKNDAKSDLEALLELLGQLKIANDGGNTVNIQNNIINQIKNSIQIHSKNIQNITVQNSLKELLQENKISETTINMAIAGVEQSLKKKIINHEIVFGGDVAFYPLSTHENHEFSVENKAVHLAENFKKSYTKNQYVTQNTFAYPTNVQAVYESIGQNFYNYIFQNSRIIETIYDKKKAPEHKEKRAAFYRYALDNDFLYYEKTEQVYRNQENYNTEVSLYQNQENHDTNAHLHQTQEIQNRYTYAQTNLQQNQENIDVLHVENRSVVEKSYEDRITAMEIDASVLQNTINVSQKRTPNILHMDTEKLPLPKLLGKKMMVERVYRSLLQYDFHVMETLPQNIRNILNNVALFVTQNRNSQVQNTTLGKMERMHFRNRVFYSRILKEHTTLENTFTEAKFYESEVDNSLSLIQKMQGESIYQQQENILHQDTFRGEYRTNVNNSVVSNVANHQRLSSKTMAVSWATLFQEFHKVQGEYNTLVIQNQLKSVVLPSSIKQVFMALQIAGNNVLTNTTTKVQQNQTVSNYSAKYPLHLMHMEHVEHGNVEYQNTVHESTENKQSSVYMTQQNVAKGDDISLSYHQENNSQTEERKTHIANGYFSKNANTQRFHLVQNKGISTVLQNIFHNQQFGTVALQQQKNGIPIGVEKVFSALQMSLVHNYFGGVVSQSHQQTKNSGLSYMQIDYHRQDGDVTNMENTYLAEGTNAPIPPLMVNKSVGVVLQSLFHNEKFGGVEQKNTIQLLGNTHPNEQTTNATYQTYVQQQVKDANTLLEYRVFNSIHQSPLVYHLQQGMLSQIFGGESHHFGGNQKKITNQFAYGNHQNTYHFAAGKEMAEAFLPVVQRLETKEVLFQKAKVFYSYLMKNTEETTHIAKEVLQENREQIREENTILLQRHKSLSEMETKELSHSSLLEQSHQRDVISTRGIRHFQKDSLWNYAYQTDVRHSERAHQEEHHETTQEITHKEWMIFKKEQETKTEEISKTKITELVEEVLSERIVAEGFTLQQETIIQKIVGQVLMETKEESTEPQQDVNVSGYIEEIYEKVYEKIERALVSERRRFGQ